MDEGFLAEGTVRQVQARLTQLPEHTFVRVFVGKPSLKLMAHKAQAEAAAHGMTDAEHDRLIASLKADT